MSEPKYKFRNGKVEKMTREDIAENNKTLIKFLLYELDIQFSELNGAADEFYAEWSNDRQSEKNKQKQKEILCLIKDLNFH